MTEDPVTVVAPDFAELGWTVGQWVHFRVKRPRWWHPLRLVRWWWRDRVRKRNTYRVTSISGSSFHLHPAQRRWFDEMSPKP